MTNTKPSTLYTALLAAQRAMGPVKKDASNPAFRSKYATLQSVIETVEQPLWDNGLVLLQRFEPSVDRAPVLITEIVHAESGERITSAIDVASKDMHDPQKVGSAITYYRRYSLLALLGLAPEDDDANTASKPDALANFDPRRPQDRPRRPSHPSDDGFGPAPSKPAPLDTDQVLIILGEMDEGRTAWHEIKRYADDQGDGRDDAGVTKIHAKLKAIADGRRASAAPAPAPAD